jgi:hypothetical protein
MSAAKSLVVLWLLAACDKSSSPKPAEGSGSAVVAPVAADAAVVALADAAVDAGATVDAAPIACTAAAIGTARKQADAHVKAGSYDAAIALLRGDSCYLEADQTDALKSQIAWRLSDLSFAYYKAGQFASCYAVASAEATPYAGNVGFFFGEDDAVMKALEHNAKLCQDAAAKERGPFVAAGTCTFVEDAHALPASALEPTDKAACIVFEPGKKDTDDLNVCGDVTLVRQSKKGKLSRTKLAVTEGNLANGSVCCNIERVSFGRRGANLAILVETLGRDCDGGTASSEEQHAYEVKGAALDLFHTLNATAH